MHLIYKIKIEKKKKKKLKRLIQVFLLVKITLMIADKKII